jgi:prepilin-type N-terminal cleavage/methylation domain-containing protein
MRSRREPSVGRRTRRARRSAFTLIEVLVTLAILSTGIVVVLQAFNTSLVALGESRDTLRAYDLLARRVAETELALREQGAEGASSVSEGRFTGRHADFLWRVEVRDASVPGAGGLTGGLSGPQLKEIAASVWRTGATRRHTAVTFVALSARKK